MLLGNILLRNRCFTFITTNQYRNSQWLFSEASLHKNVIKQVNIKSSNHI